MGTGERQKETSREMRRKMDSKGKGGEKGKAGERERGKGREEGEIGKGKGEKGVRRTGKLVAGESPRAGPCRGANPPLPSRCRLGGAAAAAPAGREEAGGAQSDPRRSPTGTSSAGGERPVSGRRGGAGLALCRAGPCLPRSAPSSRGGAARPAALCRWDRDWKARERGR